jgi:hypothetical protein
VGAVLLGLGVVVLLVKFFVRFKSGRIAGANPWHAGGLEWATSSPPPAYNFRRLRIASSRYSLWDGGNVREVTGLSTHQREVLVTRLHDAAPNHRYHMAGDSWWPPVMALLAGATLLGLVFHPVWVPIGIVVMLLALAGWFWHTHEPKPIPPGKNRSHDERAVDAAREGAQP